MNFINRPKQPPRIEAALLFHADILRYDFYVAHENTGYGYKNNFLPYDYADGGAMNVPYRMSYEKFVEKAEELFEDYIRMNDKMCDYSLVEHANRELEIW